MSGLVLVFHLLNQIILSIFIIEVLTHTHSTQILSLLVSIFDFFIIIVMLSSIDESFREIESIYLIIVMSPSKLLSEILGEHHLIRFFGFFVSRGELVLESLSILDDAVGYSFKKETGITLDIS